MSEHIQCRLCPNARPHIHELDAGELAEIEAVRRGERQWRYDQ